MRGMGWGGGGGDGEGRNSGEFMEVVKGTDFSILLHAYTFSIEEVIIKYVQNPES